MCFSSDFCYFVFCFFFFFQAEDGIRDLTVTGVQTCALPILAMAVNFGYRRHRANTTALMLITAAFGATFVGMQAFEWTKLIREGVRPWGNPLGATQFGSCFFMITGFHGLHVSAGVVFLFVGVLWGWGG